MSRFKPCSICGQKRAFIPTNVIHNGPICPKCGHHDLSESPLWERLFFSLPFYKQACLLGVEVENLPPIPAKYRRALHLPETSV